MRVLAIIFGLKALLLEIFVRGLIKSPWTKGKCFYLDQFIQYEYNPVYGSQTKMNMNIKYMQKCMLSEDRFINYKTQKYVWYVFIYKCMHGYIYIYISKVQQKISQVWNVNKKSDKDSIPNWILLYKQYLLCTYLYMVFHKLNKFEHKSRAANDRAMEISFIETLNDHILIIYNH